MGVVGPYVFQYSGSFSDTSDTSNPASSDLHAFYTYANDMLLPKWINLSDLKDQPLSRVHYASAVVGTNIWIHGGETRSAVGDTNRRALGSNSALKNQLWLLSTSPDAPPINASCPRGFERSPPPFGPCIDISEIFVSRIFCVIFLSVKMLVA
jgi:hypothetical protein